MGDRFDTHATKLDSPGENHYLITPGPNELPRIPRVIYCEADGTATIVDRAGTPLTYTLVRGQVLTFRGVRVTAATATLYGWD